MKRLLTIALIAISFTGFAQMPDLNRAMLVSVDSYIGQKVGDGVCKTLIDSVLLNNGAGKETSNGVGSYCLALDPKINIIYSGDIIYFDKVKMKDGSYIENHIAFVYALNGRNKYYIIHQNYDVSSLDESIVIITRLDLGKIKKGKVSFYRPLTTSL